MAEAGMSCTLWCLHALPNADAITRTGKVRQCMHMAEGVQGAVAKRVAILDLTPGSRENTSAGCACREVCWQPCT